MRVELSIANPDGAYDGFVKELIEDVDYEGIGDLSYTITALNSRSSGTQLSFTEEITFIGEIVNILKEVFIKSGVSLDSYVTVIVIDDCCGVDIPLTNAVITRDDFKFCLSNGDQVCKINTDLRAADSSARDYVCIRSALINDPSIIWPDGKEFRFQKHPAVPYCNSVRPAVVGLMLQFLAALVTITFITLLPLIAYLAVLVKIINTILSFIGKDEIDFDKSIEGDQGIFDLVKRLMVDELAQMVSGCGFNHPAPLVRSYISNVCIQCGDLQLSSSILESQSSLYYNMVMMGPTFRKGNRPLYNNGKLNEIVAARYWKYNTPTITGGELLDRLAVLFNARWWVEGNVLYFEQAVVNTEPTLRAYEEGLEIESICLESEGEGTYSGLNVKYEQDGVDVVGDEARYLYNDIIPFYDITNRNTPVKRKLREESFFFSVSRYKGDKLDEEDDWAVARSVSVLYNGSRKLVAALLGSKASNFKDGTLLLEKDVTSLSKLIILENNYDVVNSYAIEKDRNYNYPLWFSAKAYGGLWANSDPPNSSKIAISPNMWQFWLDEDVRIASSRLNGYDITLTLAKSCIWYKNFMLSITGDISKKYYVEFKIDGDYYTAEFNSIQISGNKIVIKSKLI